ncbi:MAG: formate/nitrite transporter family protein [Thermotogae bacterium]|nr:formate/nitrite transporter family protein [Thermotogota bacterium]
MTELNFFSPPQIGENIEGACQRKCQVSFGRLFVLAILAGAYIAFGAELSIMVGHDIGIRMSIGFAKFLAGSVFSVGLMLVVIAGAELFTGDCLLAIPAMRCKVSWGALLRTWGIVYLGNFVGSIILVLFMYYSGLWKVDKNLVGAAALNIANGKVHLSFVEALMRGIGCNWLVCLAVWMAASAKNIVGKIFAIYFPIMAFVASGFEHSVANMFFIPYGIFLKGVPAVIDATGKGVAAFNGLTWGSLLVNNLIPVTIGNIIGGSFFVGMLYWYIYLKKEKGKI